jgi:hypothetical protein
MLPPMSVPTLRHQHEGAGTSSPEYTAATAYERAFSAAAATRSEIAVKRVDRWPKEAVRFQVHDRLGICCFAVEHCASVRLTYTPYPPAPALRKIDTMVPSFSAICLPTHDANPAVISCPLTPR